MAKKKPLSPGQAGGRAIVRMYGRDYMAEIGSLGGRKTVKRYGRKYMSLLGSLANENMSKTRRTLTIRAINKRIKSLRPKTAR